MAGCVRRNVRTFRLGTAGSMFPMREARHPRTPASSSGLASVAALVSKLVPVALDLTRKGVRPRVTVTAAFTLFDGNSATWHYRPNSMVDRAVSWFS